MLKVLLFLLGGAIIVLLAWLLAGIPGHVAASIGAYTIETSTPVAILALIALLFVAALFMRVLRWVFSIPRLSVDWRNRGRLSRGEKTVTRVLVALAAGEPATARDQARRARKLLGDSPQTLLLAAEAGRLSGREDEAEEAFRALLKQADAKFLGLSGLLRQAIDRRDWPEALVLAKEAEVAHPGTSWLRKQRAELALHTENWAEALELTGPDPRRTTYYLAAASAEPDPKRSLAFAKLAWRQDPGFAPATLAYANRLRAAGYEKRAQSCVGDAWQRAPHPDLAAFALALEPNKLARVRAAKRLVAANTTHPESRILLAQVALDAGLTGEARHQIEAAEEEGSRQRRLCLLLAEIEEHERGDTEAGRVAQRDALRLASTAEPGPRWQCTNCNADHSAWHPRCDSCASVGTIQWLATQRSQSLPAIIA